MIRVEERANAKTMLDKVADLNDRRAQLELGGGKERIDKQHASGKLSARERVTAHRAHPLNDRKAGEADSARHVVLEQRFVAK